MRTINGMGRTGVVRVWVGGLVPIHNDLWGSYIVVKARFVLDTSG